MLVVVSLVAGLVVAGPRRPLASRWFLGAVVLAVVLATPQLVFQATHDWPQVAMAGALSDNNADDVRVLMWPFLVLILGPSLVPVWVAGLVALRRRPAWRPVRMLVPAFGTILLLTFLGGGQVYYPSGLLMVLWAAGCVPAAELMARSLSWRWVTVVAVALNGVVSLVLALPVLPLSVLGGTPVPGLNQTIQDQVGWPAYVRQVAAVVRSLPPAERARAVVVASNYGEAGALVRYGSPLGVPAVFSGQNGLYEQGRPPAGADVVIVVGGQLDDVAHLFASCDITSRLDNGVGVAGEEQGQPVAVCRGPSAPWTDLWPRFHHLD